MTRTLGRTDRAVRRGDDKIHVRPTFSHLPTARGINLARISTEVESIFKELCLGLNPRDISHATQECSANVLCDVWQAHFNSEVRSALQITFSRTLTRRLSSRKTIPVIHKKTTSGYNCVLKVFNVSHERQVYRIAKATRIYCRIIS